MVGIYNVVWAVTNALAFFIGGTLVEKFGFKSIFYLPVRDCHRAAGAGVLAAKTCGTNCPRRRP